MKPSRYAKWMGLMVGGAALFQFAGCLGPNPGFFISSAAANATISTLVGSLINGVLSANRE
ncbi:MAG: hypothetical protein ACE5E5_11585 [Phycisphaerae bacterium]